MTCIQGFICAVPTKNRGVFIQHAQKAAQAFHDYGCVAAVECWGDDVTSCDVPSFPAAVLAQPDETVVFSWYVWPTKDAHDAFMRAMPDDPRLNPETNPMPFDGKRVIFGAFETVLELGTYLPGGYVDGFVLAVPHARRHEFETFAKTCDPVFMEHGAHWIMENWGVDVPEGRLTDFKRAVQARPDEAIVFSWVQWADRATRDAGNEKIMNDPRLAAFGMPFDSKRLIFGGFQPVVEVG